MFSPGLKRSWNWKKERKRLQEASVVFMSFETRELNELIKN